MEEKQPLKVAILTTFYNWDKAYSLVNVVEQQLKALVKHGYKPTLGVLENFKTQEEMPQGVEIKKFLPPVRLADYATNQSLQPDFYEQVEKIKKSLEENLQDFDIVFTHDWIFQGWFLVYNLAMRQANLKCKWLHWVHSAPSPRPVDLKPPYDCRFKTMPNSKLIYMNDYDTLRLAEMYGGTLDDVRVVYNPMDFRNLPIRDLTKKIIEDYDLLNADIIDVYPFSMTRALGGKQPDKVIWVIGKMKQLGKSVRLIFCNAHCNSQPEKELVKKYLDYAKQFGLTEKEVIFTSLIQNENPIELYLYKCPYCAYEYGIEKEGQIKFKKEKESFVCDNANCKKRISRDQLRKIDRSPVPRFPYQMGVCNQVVRELMQLSNVFIFPTMSENCPLILLEAAASKCLLVLNESFPPLRDFFGKDALYFKFGSLSESVSYENEEKWYEEVAKIIVAELNKNKPLNAFNTLKQKFNYDFIFKNQLEPLFYEK